MHDNHVGAVEPANVRDYYDEWTIKYVEDFGDCIQAHRPTDDDDLLDYLLTRAGLRDGQSVLDAGCGVCGPARYFARRRNIHLDTITISPVQAEIARAGNIAAGLDDRIHVTVGDFHRLSEIYGRERFDTVYFLESLSHSARPGETLAEVYAVLKPGGTVYVKDYFIRPVDDEQEQQRVLAVVARVDRLFATKTAWADDIKSEFRHAGFFCRWTERPQFTVDNSRWQQFEARHHLDLFDGGPSFDWSEWWEMRYQKP
jgi:cyclopropane fatty-acyl-phospholipid synthase-like methyltransferase